MFPQCLEAWIEEDNPVRVMVVFVDEREAGRNVEVMWRTGRRAPDHKTIADFRKEFEGSGIDPGDQFP